MTTASGDMITALVESTSRVIKRASQLLGRRLFRGYLGMYGWFNMAEFSLTVINPSVPF
jgi:hypothetical protein